MLEGHLPCGPTALCRPGSWLICFYFMQIFTCSISIHLTETSFGQEPGVLRCTLYASHSIWHWLVTKWMSGECGDKLTKTSPLITSKFLDWCVTRHLEQVVAGYGRTSGLHQGRTWCWGGLFRWPASHAQILVLSTCGFEHLCGLMAGILPGAVSLWQWVRWFPRSPSKTRVNECY